MSDTKPRTEQPRAVVVGGGVAGLTAGTFLARAGFDTAVINHGESILERNAHLENVPGFPAGINPRLFVDLLERGAKRNGCLLERGSVRDLIATDGQFRVKVGDTEDESGASTLTADYVIASSWSDVGYLRELDPIGLIKRGSKTYVDVDDDGRTGIDGLYAAGRVAGKAHQATVCAGHGADVALTLIEDSDVPYYHDWVAPEGYFTDRGRDVPPGCEEIDAAERRRRERESIETMSEAFECPHPEEPTVHPSLRGKDGE